MPGSKDRYLALFNTTDASAPVTASLDGIGLGENVHVRDLWPQRQTYRLSPR